MRIARRLGDPWNERAELYARELVAKQEAEDRNGQPIAMEALEASYAFICELSKDRHPVNDGWITKTYLAKGAKRDASSELAAAIGGGRALGKLLEKAGVKDASRETRMRGAVGGNAKHAAESIDIAALVAAAERAGFAEETKNIEVYMHTYENAAHFAQAGPACENTVRNTSHTCDTTSRTGVPTAIGELHYAFTHLPDGGLAPTEPEPTP
jgi:hypothetical protein